VFACVLRLPEERRVTSEALGELRVLRKEKLGQKFAQL
jgi:hypothetical protein